MKFVDTFLFSEPHEADVLWVKLNVESHLFDEWVVVENSYTHQGQYKGYYLKDLINNDDRFEKLIGKIHVVESDIRPGFLESKNTGHHYSESKEMEKLQRSMALEHLLDTCSDDDYVLISDVDECLDTESRKRQKLLLKKVSTGCDLILVPRIRYWFDYDNRWLARRCVPMVTIRQIKKDNRIYRYRKKWITTPVIWKHDMVFEYSYCFSKQGIIRKYQTFQHTGYTTRGIERGLLCNHVPVPKNGTTKKDRPHEFWFVKRKLNSRNSPAFVRRNIKDLKTAVISPEYVRNRAKEYPDRFSKNKLGNLRLLMGLYKGMYGYFLWENSNAYRRAYNIFNAIKKTTNL